MFSPTNADVSCDEAEYPLLEEATKLVPVPEGKSIFHRESPSAPSRELRRSLL